VFETIAICSKLDAGCDWPDANAEHEATWAIAIESNVLRLAFHLCPGFAIRARQKLLNSTDGKAGARIDKISFKSRFAQQATRPAGQGFHQARMRQHSSVRLFIARSHSVRLGFARCSRFEESF